MLQVEVEMNGKRDLKREAKFCGQCGATSLSRALYYILISVNPDFRSSGEDINNF